MDHMATTTVGITVTMVVLFRWAEFFFPVSYNVNCTTMNKTKAIVTIVWCLQGKDVSDPLKVLVMNGDQLKLSGGFRLAEAVWWVQIKDGCKREQTEATLQADY